MEAPHRELLHLSITDEARQVRGLAQDPEARLVHDLLAKQFEVLHSRAGVLVTFCGVVITTTGFSGRMIAGTNRLAQALIIAGVATVLAAAWIVLVRVMRIRWVTAYPLDQTDASIQRVLTERDRRRETLRRATYLAMLGMTFYVIAIMIMLCYPARSAVELKR